MGLDNRHQPVKDTEKGTSKSEDENAKKVAGRQKKSSMGTVYKPKKVKRATFIGPKRKNARGNELVGGENTGWGYRHRTERVRGTSTPKKVEEWCTARQRTAPKRVQ